MIDYTADIAEGMFALIASDLEYQVPGKFNLPSYWAELTPGKKRLLMFVEIVRAYMMALEDVKEAALFYEVSRRINRTIKLGQGDTPAQARIRAMQYITATYRDDRPLSCLLLETGEHLRLERPGNILLEQEIDN